MEKFKKTERGQALYLIVFGIVALLGFAALSIDGGHIFAERRKAQNAADTAAYAMALKLIETNSDSQAETEGYASALNSGYPDVSPIDVFTDSPYSYNGDSDNVYVSITTPVETSLIQFVYSGPVEVFAEAVVHVIDVDQDVMGNAIITLGTSCGNPTLLEITGGGSSGGIEAYNGGMFVNAPGGTCCAMDPGSSSGGTGIFTDSGISSVGSCDLTSVSGVDSTGFTGNFNGGKPIQDPLYFLAEPECSPSNAYTFEKTAAQFETAVNSGPLAPGIYCITGTVHLSGSQILEGTNVLLYFKTGGLEFTGGAGMELSAPDSSFCSTSPQPDLNSNSVLDPNEICKYEGIAIFVARGNTSEIQVKGNGGSAVNGLIYGPDATVSASGGGSDPNETEVTGQIIAAQLLGNGNGSLVVTFDNTFTYTAPPMLNLAK